MVNISGIGAYPEVNMRPIMLLNDTRLRKLKAKTKPYKLYDGAGLCIEVFPRGSALWRLEIRVGGKLIRRGLGSYPEVPLALAREKAREMRARLRGEGEGAAAEEAPPEISFRDLCEDWARTFLPKLTPKEARRKRHFLDSHILPAIGGMALSEIRPSAILEKVLRPIEAEGHLETAHRVRSVLGQVLRYGVVAEAVERDFAFDLRGALPQPSVRHRATMLEPERIGRLIADIRGYSGGRTVAMALRLLPYLFVRPGELRHAEWGEFDLEEGVWRIPAGKMKMRSAHIVPLAGQVAAWLREYREWAPWDGYLFPGARTFAKPISDMAINAALRYLGYGREEITGHGFRAMASTVLNEKGVHPDWIERQLAHVERNGVRAAYNHAEHLPERRTMMQWWADWLDGLAGPA
jgi:integrase